jgi:cyclophilin family peptidyl-prolyl cis-trans isomerase
MHALRLTLAGLLACCLWTAADASTASKSHKKSTPKSATKTMSETHPKVLLETSAGNITLELDAEKAPKSVANFIAYVKAGHYDGTVFHRVIKGFMIQGGGYTEADYSQKPTQAPISNESTNGLANKRGTIAMARTNDPHSATAQFFINHKDNDFLDAGARGQWGYAVFGKVIEGMDVVDKIADTPTGRLPPFGQDVPTTKIVIKKATVVG